MGILSETVAVRYAQKIPRDISFHQKLMAGTGQRQVIWYTELLPRATKKALDFLSGQNWLRKSAWYLAGGTALSLQVGHRQSVDLDFFNPAGDFSASNLIQRFPKDQWENGFIKEAAVYGKLLGAKTSFIGYSFFAAKQKPLWYGAIRVLQPRDIAVMKIIAISQRGKKRDFVDLYWYCNNRESLEEIVLLVPDQYPYINHNFHHIVRSLTYFADAEEDPMPRLNFSVDWGGIKSYFRREAPRLARKLLGLK